MSDTSYPGGPPSAVPPVPSAPYGPPAAHPAYAGYPGQGGYPVHPGRGGHFGQPYPYAMPPAPFLGLRGLSVAIMVLLGLLAAVDVASLALGYRITEIIGSMETDPERYSAREVDATDAIYAVSGISQFVLYAAIGVCFLVWFWRARSNAAAFVPDGHRMAPGWAIGAWFIPVANLWLPCRVALDIWRAGAAADPATGRPVRVPVASVHLWWWVWTVSALVGRVAGSLNIGAETPDEGMLAIRLLMAADALDIVAAVFAILFVRKLTRMQEVRAGESGRSIPVGSPV